MYQNVFELPNQVRNSLDESDQKTFLDAYNKANPKTTEEARAALRKAWMACKDLPSSFSFKIIASVEDIDIDREILDMNSLKNHMDDFIDRGGNIQNDHHNFQLGTIWDWEPYKVDGKDGIVVWGNLFGGDSVYDDAREAFVKGTNSLSVAGSADKGRFQCDEKGCYTRRNVNQLLEISLCKVPANSYCKLQWYNEDAKFSKSRDDSELPLDVIEYTIHKDYNYCPIQRLKRDLKRAGFEAHARTNGVFIPTDDFDKTRIVAKSCGIIAEPAEGGALLNRRNDLIEKYYREGTSEGYMDSAGNLKPTIRKSKLFEMAGYGLIANDGKTWSLVFPDADLDENSP